MQDDVKSKVGTALELLAFLPKLESRAGSASHALPPGLVPSQPPRTDGAADKVAAGHFLTA